MDDQPLPTATIFYESAYSYGGGYDVKDVAKRIVSMEALGHSVKHIVPVSGGIFVIYEGGNDV